MGVIKVPSFYRIINLYFLNQAGIVVRKIECPQRGRKPSIEINGTYTTKDYIPAFNVTVKNLYLNLNDTQYSKLRVTCGYENQLKTFTGTILSIYQESSGPEGTTVIQCQEGNLEDLLSATVDLKIPKSTPVIFALEKIKTALKLQSVIPGNAVKSLTLKEDLVITGTAISAIDELKKSFTDEDLIIYENDKKLYAFALNKGDVITTKKMKFLSGLPQTNPGGEGGSYYTTVTGPWMPDLSIGDRLQIPLRQYIKYFQMVGTENQNNQIIVVTGLQFHFGTTGGANSMTVQGYGV